MPWECIFKKHHDKDDVGSATARYYEIVDEVKTILFSFTRSINGKDQAIQFVADAKAAKVKHDADETKNNTIATAITNKLNQ
jgi:hypothetical protein